LAPLQYAKIKRIKRVIFRLNFLFRFDAGPRNYANFRAESVVSIPRGKASLAAFWRHRFSAFWLRSKCSICSSQFELWDVFHWKTNEIKCIFATWTGFSRCLHHPVRELAPHCITARIGSFIELKKIILKHDLVRPGA